jgi:flagellar M-ring protein FliF
MPSQILQLWNGLSARQRATIVLSAAAVLAGLYGLVQWRTERDFVPLFENLAAEEAGQIVANLKESGVSVRLAGDGRRVLVPSAQVDEQRLALAAQGLPQTGRIGFEIFDKSNFGATDFTEQVNYQRAIEGELERSLLTIQEIERARVHITFAKNSVFLENQQPAKGSVMLKLRAGQQLQSRQVSAVAHLVASAVEGLMPDQVSIVDMRGNLLSRPRASNAMEDGEPPDGMLQYRRRIEEDLQLKLIGTLDPLLGEGRYRVSVAADLDLSSGDESAELFDPDQSVMASTQKSEDISNTARAGGIPGAASNLPGGSGATRNAGAGVVRRSESVAFQTSRTVRHRKLPQGMLRRVSVAVLLDQRLRWEGSGDGAQRVLEAPEPATLDKVRELVTGAIGLSEERGDQLVVESMPFEQTLNAPPPPDPTAVPEAPSTEFQLPAFLSFLPQGVPLWVWGAVAGGVLLLLMLAVFLLLRRRRAKIRARLAGQQELAAASANPQLSGQAGVGAAGQIATPQQMAALSATPEPGEDIDTFIQRQQQMLREKESAAIASLKQTSSARNEVEALKQHLAEAVREDANGAAQILRTWLTAERN